jgi:hypothetical protein
MRSSSCDVRKIRWLFIFRQHLSIIIFIHQKTLLFLVNATRGNRFKPDFPLAQRQAAPARQAAGTPWYVQ